MRLLLDTCTFLWLVDDHPSLSARAREAIVDPANDVYLSAASAWEIVIKHAAGRLQLTLPVDDYIPRQRELHGIERLPITRGRYAGIGQAARPPPGSFRPHPGCPGDYGCLLAGYAGIRSSRATRCRSSGSVSSGVQRQRVTVSTLT